MRSAWALALAVVLAAAAAHAKPPKEPPPPPPADVDTAEQLYAKLDYDKANDVATRVLKLKGLSHDQLVRATKILAITDAILDKDDDAKDAFLTLLVYDPDYSVDANLGPRVAGPFMEARGHFRSLPSKPGLEVVPSLRAEGGQLRVTTRDPTKLTKKVNVGWRWLSTGDYTVTSVAVGEASVEVAAAPGGRTRLEYYAQALDDRDNAVFETGTASVPKSAFADLGPKATGVVGGTTGPKGEDQKGGGGVLSSPVFWIITGALVAGGGTALFFVLRKENPTSASLSPQIHCGAEICK